MWVQYYDASSWGTAFSFLCIPLLFVAIGLLMITAVKNEVITYEHEGSSLFVMYIWTGGALLMTTFAAIMMIKEYNKLVDIIQKKEYVEVEGFVENHIENTKERIKVDSFTVDTVRFGCGSPIGFGFGKIKAEGSPIYSGQYVKIQCFEGRIFKLWVKQKEY